MIKRTILRLSPCLCLFLIVSCANAFQLAANEARISSVTASSSLSFPSPTKTKGISTNDVTLRNIHRLHLLPKSDQEVEQMEEARLGIWKSRRAQIRSMLRGAEALKNFRLAEGFVPELDPETGRPLKDDSGKTAVTITAFAVTAGAIVLRIGGRAALVSAVGLDFLTDNPDLQGQVASVLEASESMDPIVKGGLFCLAWTVVKVLCFDAGGVVLALASGILFGGVLEGAVMSAFGATFGSSVAFGLAKADTPVRKKALEVVKDNPSLRGIEKVVAEDGLKAVLTLRLAPILPIPLGMYNYVYGISNVKYLDFAGGKFLGSLKPYLLDSYLGYFGKTLVDGTASQDGGLQDYLLVGVLGVSVLIGVFASQLAAETWDAVLAEQEEESKAKIGDGVDDDDVTTEIFGWNLPQWAIGFQYALQDAEERMNTLVMQEYYAKVWNCTETVSFMGMQISKSDLPEAKNPAKTDASSPEITGRYQGIDFGASTCDGLVLSPVLFTYFLKLSDPLFDEEEFLRERRESEARPAANGKLSGANDGGANNAPSISAFTATPSTASLLSSDIPTISSPTEIENEAGSIPSLEFQTVVLLNRLQPLRDEAQKRLDEINEELAEMVRTSTSSTETIGARSAATAPISITSDANDSSLK